MSFIELVEKSSYKVYHKTYSSAIAEIEPWLEKQGYQVDKEVFADEIGLGPTKPKNGQTNKFDFDIYSIPTISKPEPKLQRKRLHVQVYGDGNYELNMYIL